MSWLPVAALGGREWIAHLYQFLLLCGFLVASVSVARRLGCDPRQANTVGLLVASNPVTLAMAATCMPDVMAAMFGMAGLDRAAPLPRTASLGYGAGIGVAAGRCRALPRQHRAAAAGGGSIALAARRGNARPNASGRWSSRRSLATVFVSLNRGPAAHATVGAAFQSLTSLRNVPRNLVAFLCYQALAGPLLVYALLSRGWKFAGIVAALVAARSGPLHGGCLRQPGALRGPGGIRHLLRRGGGGSGSALERPLRTHFLCLAALLPLFVWLARGMVALPYVHMAPSICCPACRRPPC